MVSGSHSSVRHVRTPGTEADVRSSLGCLQHRRVVGCYQMRCVHSCLLRRTTSARGAAPDRSDTPAHKTLLTNLLCQEGKYNEGTLHPSQHVILVMTWYSSPRDPGRGGNVPLWNSGAHLLDHNSVITQIIKIHLHHHQNLNFTVSHLGPG